LYDRFGEKGDPVSGFTALLVKINAMLMWTNVYIDNSEDRR